MSQAAPYLDDGEEVVYWVRARRPEGRGEGFVFITPRRCIVHFTSQKDYSGSVLWDEIHAWGLTGNSGRGPVLGIESSDEILVAELHVTTRQMVDEVAAFVARFAELAPEPDSFPRHDKLGEFRAHHEVEVSKLKKSIGGHTKRVVVTVIGVVLVVGGILITPLPGPWSFPIVLGGLAVLSREYDWAKDTLEWVKQRYQDVKKKIKERTHD
ncbi:MAG: PGPGW domain-containing protein [Actinomycetota bacterium]